MLKLSVVIITRNEEKNIRRCLESVMWADEIVVVDSMSSDKTKCICQEYDCKFIESTWLGFGKMKAFAVDSAENDWILSIDADEVLPPKLIDEIKQLLNSKPMYAGYRIKRNSFYLGKMIMHCGWNHDLTLRLFNRKYGNFNCNIVHEFVDLKGKISNLNNNMLHYTYPDINTHYLKMKHYSSLGAKKLFEQNKTSTPCKAILRGILKLIKMYVLQLGFLDGKNGFLLSVNSAWGVYYKYIILWEMSKLK